MTTSRDALLHDVEAFLESSGMPPSVFGEKLMNDRHLVRRLRAGRQVTLTTADRIRTFIKDWRPPTNPKQRREARAA